MGIVNQLYMNGESIQDQNDVEKVLKSLPKKYEMVWTTIFELKDLNKFSVDELTRSLLSHEARLSLDDQPFEHAFVNRGKGNKWTDKSDIQCYYYKKYGHYEKNAGRSKLI